MSTGDARRGRRDNGLVAAEYAAAGDVDPRVGEHLLDVLALEGIAAYLRPTTDLHPVTRATWMPDRPIDRLYVDRAHLSTARDYLRQLAADAEPTRTEPTRTEPTPAGASAPGATPGPGVGAVPPAVEAESSAAEADAAEPTTAPSASAGASGSGSGPTKGDEPDIDAAWAEIIAGYADEAPEPRVPGILPPTPIDPIGPAERLTSVEPPKPKPTLDVDAPSLLTGFDTFGATLPDEEVEDFTPPPAPPMPRPSLPTVLAVIGIVGGLVIFLSPRIVPLPQALVMLLGFAGIVSGFVTLVWRLRPGGDDDDDFDPHHGARV